MKNMKRLACFLLAVFLMLPMLPHASAATVEAVQAANTLYELGLFQGTGTDASGNPIFDLDATPTRAQAVTMLVRLLGKENEASSKTWTVPFTDVPASHWSSPYVGYAYSNGLTTGMSGTSYGGGYNTTATQYLTFVLRALGYKSGTDFQWDKAWELTDKLGITHGQYNAYSKFTRGDVAIVSLKALDAKVANSDKLLAEVLGLPGTTPATDPTDPTTPTNPTTPTDPTTPTNPVNPDPQPTTPVQPDPTPECKAIELNHEYGPMTVTTYYSTGRYWNSNQISSLVFTKLEKTNINKYKLYFSMQGRTDDSRARVYVYFYDASGRMMDKIALSELVAANTDYNISAFAYVDPDLIENSERIAFFSYSGHAAEFGSNPSNPDPGPTNPDPDTPEPSGKTVADLVNYIRTYGKTNVNGNKFITMTKYNNGAECQTAISYQPNEGTNGVLSFMCDFDSSGYTTLTTFDYDIAGQRAADQLTVFFSQNSTNKLLFAAKADFNISTYTLEGGLTFRESDFVTRNSILYPYDKALPLCHSSVKLATTTWEALLLSTAGMSLTDIGFNSFTLN